MSDLFVLSEKASSLYVFSPKQTTLLISISHVSLWCLRNLVGYLLMERDNLPESSVLNFSYLTPLSCVDTRADGTFLSDNSATCSLPSSPFSPSIELSDFNDEVVNPFYSYESLL